MDGLELSFTIDRMKQSLFSWVPRNGYLRKGSVKTIPASDIQCIEQGLDQLKIPILDMNSSENIRFHWSSKEDQWKFVPDERFK